MLLEAVANTVPPALTNRIVVATGKLSQFDVAIVGAGPAGLSAAITLGRARRRVVVLDHGKPRNYAARSVHCFLGAEGLSPWELRERGRREAAVYGVEFLDVEVRSARCLSNLEGRLTLFAVCAADREIHVRSILLATGMMDELPDISGIEDFYGEIVHHCPYCDGFEHRDEFLVALGSARSAARLGAELLAWSKFVTVCTNGELLSETDRLRLDRLGICYHTGAITRLDGLLRELHFADGTSTTCQGLFFSAGQSQTSELPKLLGCNCDGEGLIVTKGKQCTNIRGLYLAGDADGDVQFSIVAAAEGAVAATAIHKELLDQDQSGKN